MGDGPNLPNETAWAELSINRRRNAWLEQRLHCLIGELARLKAGVPLQRFLRGALAAYRRFLFKAGPPTAFMLGQRFRPSSRGAGANGARGRWP